MIASPVKAALTTMVIVSSVAGCSAVQVAGAAVSVGTTAVRGVVGAGRLVVRGTSAGLGRLTEAEGDLPAGALVCFDDAGDVYASPSQRNGEAYCP